MKNRRALLIAALVALISWFLLKNQINQERQDRLGQMTHVVLAEIDITQGTSLTRDHIERGFVPEKYLSPVTVLAEDVDAILGHPVTRNIRAGSQLSWDDLKSHSSRLSHDIAYNSRAFTLEVDPSSTQGGQLKPGDHVDVLAIFNHEEIPSCRTILQNIKIMAVGGQRLDYGITSGFASVTLELSPDQCQHLALARDTGKIVLTLRCENDHDLIEAAPTHQPDLGEVTYQIKPSQIK